MRITLALSSITLASFLTACASGGPVSPDKFTVYSDGEYHSAAYGTNWTKDEVMTELTKLCGSNTATVEKEKSFEDGSRLMGVRCS